MKRRSLQRSLQRSIMSAGILVAFAVVASNWTMAQVPDSNGESARVVDHVPLPGAPATQMLLQNREGKMYLYIEQGDKGNVAVVDVTHPRDAAVVQHTNWPIARGNIEPLGGGIALSESPEGQTRASSGRPQNVDILDVTNPAHPQVLKTFQGVTSVLPDTARNLIFIANPRGLWIVQHRVGQTAYAVRHECTSESAINPEPDCF